MKPIELACYCLLASAFMLGGLMVVHLAGRMEQQAQAEMVIKADAFTAMTARTKSDEESLIVLNNINSRLLVYRLDVSRKELRLVANEDIARAFGLGRDKDNDRGGRRSR